MMRRPDLMTSVERLRSLRHIAVSRLWSTAKIMRSTLHIEAPRAWAMKALIGVALGVAVRIASVDESQAEHAFYPHRHLGSILHDTDSETNCIDVLDGSIGHDEARTKIKDTLYTGGTNDWDGIKWVTFQDQTLFNECPVPGFNQLMRIYFRIEGDVTPECGTGTAGCALRDFGYDDPDSGHYGFDPPQYEYHGFYVFIETDNLRNETAHIVNHEVGHALGLRNGEPDDCTGSVMHSLGNCADEPWPSDSDRGVGALRRLPRRLRWRRWNW